MDLAQIWVILKAESCWAALILYRIGNTNTNTIQIKIQNGLYLMVRGDRRDDTSQPCQIASSIRPENKRMGIREGKGAQAASFQP